MENNNSKKFKERLHGSSGRVAGLHKLLMNPNFSFYLALMSGISAIVSIIATVIAAWDILTFNITAFQSAANQYLSYLYNTSNATAVQYGQYLTSVTQSTVLILRNAFSLFVPLLAIAAVFMIIAAFYLHSKDRKTVFNGIVFSIFFSAIVLLGVLLYLPFAPTTVAMLFSYLGSYSTSGNVFIIVMYVFFLLYIVLGIISAMTSVYRMSRL
jgi:hypothetical protein